MTNSVAVLLDSASYGLSKVINFFQLRFHHILTLNFLWEYTAESC